MPIDQNIIFIAIGALTVFLLIWILWIELRLKRMFRGRHTKDLESLLTEIAGDITRIQKQIEKDNTDLRVLEKEMERSTRHIGIIRFDAFHESGGNQSFAFAALDDKKNGVVISSIHNREINRVYAKPIVNAESEHRLSDEEKEAIARALAREAPNPES